jgi:hypothetical protein
LRLCNQQLPFEIGAVVAQRCGKQHGLVPKSSILANDNDVEILLFARFACHTVPALLFYQYRLIVPRTKVSNFIFDILRDWNASYFMHGFVEGY